MDFIVSLFKSLFCCLSQVVWRRIITKERAWVLYWNFILLVGTCGSKTDSVFKRNDLITEAHTLTQAPARCLRERNICEDGIYVKMINQVWWKHTNPLVLIDLLISRKRKEIFLPKYSQVSYSTHLMWLKYISGNVDNGPRDTYIFGCSGSQRDFDLWSIKDRPRWKKKIIKQPTTSCYITLCYYCLYTCITCLMYTINLRLFYLCFSSFYCYKWSSKNCNFHCTVLRKLPQILAIWAAIITNSRVSAWKIQMRCRVDEAFTDFLYLFPICQVCVLCCAVMSNIIPSFTCRNLSSFIYLDVDFYGV